MREREGESRRREEESKRSEEARRRVKGAREWEEVGESAALMTAARRRMANCQTALVSSILISDSPFSSLGGLDSELSGFTIPCREAGGCHLLLCPAAQPPCSLPPPSVCSSLAFSFPSKGNNTAKETTERGFYFEDLCFFSLLSCCSSLCLPFALMPCLAFHSA